MNSSSPSSAVPDSGPLRTALLGNALFSSTSGAVMLCAPERVSAWIGISSGTWPVAAIGLGLVVFAADLVHQATRRRVATWRALYAIAGDGLWVLASVAGLLLLGHHLSSLGLGLVAGVALIVSGFALGQARGLLLAHRVTDDKRVRLRHCLVVGADAPAEQLWAHVADLGGISRFVPSLQNSALRGGAYAGVDAVRVCTDTGGHTWAERCVEFDSGARRITLDFLCDEEGFPFPVRAMQGGWIVSDAGDGRSEVTVWWELIPRSRWMGVILLPMLAWQMDRMIPAAVGRMTEGASSAAHLPRKSKRLARLLPSAC